MNFFIFTSSRSEYGLLKPLIKQMNNFNYAPKLIVCGSHLTKDYGYTIQEIKNDGIVIIKKIKNIVKGDDPYSILKMSELIMNDMNKLFKKKRPDYLVLLGDRFESLSAAFAAFIFRVPIIHLYGGEKTEGSLDDSIRHSITKLSNIHFCSTKTYMNRVLQLGENAEYVYNTGSLAVENIKSLKILSIHELETLLNISFTKKTFIVTYHPETNDTKKTEKTILEILKVVEELDECNFIFTYPNLDTSNKIIIKRLNEFKSLGYKNFWLFKNLGTDLFLNIVLKSNAMIGNSSSGFFEAPLLKTPTINIGDRQKGRIMMDSIINCNENYKSIIQSIKKCTSKKFLEKINNMSSPYGKGNSSKKILEKIKKIRIKNILKKKFFDLKF